MSRDLELARWIAAAPPFVYWVRYHTSPRKVNAHSPTSAKQLVKLLEAKAAGKTLQKHQAKSRRWVDIDHVPSLQDHLELYRVKP